jgi:TolB protein
MINHDAIFLLGSNDVISGQHTRSRFGYEILGRESYHGTRSRGAFLELPRQSLIADNGSFAPGKENPVISLKTTIVSAAAGIVILAMVYVEKPVAQVSADSLVRLTAVRDAYPFWSPDGKQVVFQSDRHTNMSGDFAIYIMDVDGTNIRRLTFREESDETPVWSPDGSKILFSSYVKAEDNELFLMKTDGTDITQLTNHPGRDGHQKFSPDGTRIIFNSQRDDDGKGEIRNYEIYEMKLDGSDIGRLTDFPEWDTYPSISPDGSKIVWRRVLPTGGTSDSGRNSEIFVMNRDGSDPMNLTNHSAFDGYPSWSPDCSKIVFASNRNGKTRGNFHIYIMDSDGSDVTKILDNEASVEDARPMWSPDGSKILFNRQYIADKSSMDILIISLPDRLSAKPRH